MAKEKRDLEKIFEEDFRIDWEGDFSLLSECFAIGPQYFIESERLFGSSLEFILVITKSGIQSGYIPVSRWEKFGRVCAEKSRNAEFFDSWVESYKNLADESVFLMENLEVQELSHFKKLFDLVQKYTTYQMASKAAVNFIDPNNLDIFRRLEEARKHREDFYKKLDQSIRKYTLWIREKNISYEIAELDCLRVSELVDYFKIGFLPKQEILKQRFDSSCFVQDVNGDFMLQPEEFSDLESKWFKEISKSEVKGQSAYVGKVKGICRVIKDYKNSDINEGEILVTGMTDPYFLPLMKKAGAFITDGGGLLCHAAIVARELKKPCIIGTKIATKVLKDGDEVEVNANEGLVKIIKKSV